MANGLLCSKQSFGSPLGGFDPKEVEHPVLARPAELRQEEVVFVARDWAKKLVSPSLHDLCISNYKTKREAIKK